MLDENKTEFLRKEVHVLVTACSILPKCLQAVPHQVIGSYGLRTFQTVLANNGFPLVEATERVKRQGTSASTHGLS